MMWALLSGMVFAQDVDGFVELRLQGYAGVDADVPLLAVERFRPTFEAPLSDRVVLSTTIEAGLSQGWTAQGAVLDIAEREDVSPVFIEALEIDSESNDVLQVSSASDYLAVDRLMLDVQGRRVDVRLGRQALNWGSGFAVNPSDPFPEVLLTEPWRPRSGINAARVDIPIGDLHGVQLVAGSDDAFLHPRLAGRATMNALETDWSLVGAWREEIEEGIVGVDLKGTLGVGFWFEGVAHLSAEDDAWEELVAGVDYSFPILDSLIITAQYYRNGSGQKGTGTPSLFERREPFAPVFSGTDYLMGAVAAAVTPELSANALWIHNLSDGTAFFVPAASLLAADNIDLSIAAQIPVATQGSGEFKPARRDLQLDVPTATGGVSRLDLSGIVPSTTLILWTRFNF